MIIYQATITNEPAIELAKRFNVSKATVDSLLSKYKRFGVEGVETAGKSQRQRAYLKKTKEEEFLDKFKKEADKGHIATVKEIHKAFEEKIKRKVNISTIYRMLKRNGWRKIVPRSYHPKADKVKQKAFKKTSKKK